jgi:uncharacterized surface protein with fasciclin (FAS1) repeats
MKSRKTLAGIAVLAIAVLMATFFSPAPVAAEEAPGSIVDIAVANGNFTTLVAAVQAAGLADTLAGPGSYTVFAPTDAAFATLLDQLGITADQLLADKALLTNVLLYHVAAGNLTASEVVTLGQLEMLNGDLATVSVRGSQPYINEATISATDIMASSVVIHVIDAVILPSGVQAPTGDVGASIVEVAVENPGFSSLVAALTAADLVGALSGPGPFTVFAPSNDAFQATLSSLGLTLADVAADKALLTDILLYHVASGSYTAQDLLGMDTITMLNGDTATVSVRDGKVYVNDSPVSNANIRATNGIIHVIDTVMLPPAQ